MFVGLGVVCNLVVKPVWISYHRSLFHTLQSFVPVYQVLLGQSFFTQKSSYFCTGYRHNYEYILELLAVHQGRMLFQRQRQV